jgi:hypothetical protein
MANFAHKTSEGMMPRSPEGRGASAATATVTYSEYPPDRPAKAHKLLPLRAATRARSSSCRGAMNVIKKVADGHKPFEVFIRYGDAEAVFGRDCKIDF